MRARQSQSSAAGERPPVEPGLIMRDRRRAVVLDFPFGLKPVVHVVAMLTTVSEPKRVRAAFDFCAQVGAIGMIVRSSRVLLFSKFHLIVLVVIVQWPPIRAKFAAETANSEWAVQCEQESAD